MGTRKSGRQQKVLGGQGSPEQALHQDVVLAQLGRHTLLNRFPNGGNTDEDRGLEFADITTTVAHRRFRQRTRVTVSHGTTPEKTDILKHELKDVGLGEVSQQGVRRTNVRANDFMNTSHYFC